MPAERCVFGAPHSEQKAHRHAKIAAILKPYGLHVGCNDASCYTCSLPCDDSYPEWSAAKLLFAWRLSCLSHYVDSGEGNWEESVTEVLELNFLFRRTNYPILLQARDTSNVSRRSIRQLCHELRQQEVEEFIRYNGIDTVPASLVAELNLSSLGHVKRSDSVSSFQNTRSTSDYEPETGRLTSDSDSNS